MTNLTKPESSSNNDLEIKDANLIFKAVWGQLEEDLGRSKLSFPKEIIWLGGAPGAGKGTNTPFIQSERGYTSDPIVVSSLLTTPEAQKIKDGGGMVGDREVIGLLFRALLDPCYENGVIVDGFPRTEVQVECLKILHRTLIELKNEFVDTEIARKFRYPSFRITVLFVSEAIAIQRQLGRGKEALASRKDGDNGVEIRATDFDEKLARERYRTFKVQTYEALRSLKELFHYHFINAEGSLGEVQANIAKEFQYQSSLELDHELYQDLREVPLASELVVHTRQQLVKRLERSHSEHRELFLRLVSLISSSVMPKVINYLTSGQCLINSREEIFMEPQAVEIFVDIMAERGFHVTVDDREEHIPRRVDLKTGELECEKRHHFLIKVQFRGTEIRRED